MKKFIYLGWVGLCLWSVPLTAQDQNPDPATADARIARAQFTTNIVNREPVDRVLVVSPPVEELYFFTDIRHMEGDTATHSWRYRGELISKVSFEVGGPRWRVFSKVRLEPCACRNDVNSAKAIYKQGIDLAKQHGCKEAERELSYILLGLVE